MHKILPFEMWDMVNSSIHPLGSITWTSVLTAQKIQTPVEHSSVLTCMAKGFALDGETVWTLSCVHQGWTYGEYVKFLQKRLSQSLSSQTMCFGSQNCIASLSRALLQVTGGGTARIETTSEFYRLGPEQDLEHFLHFQPMCQWVLYVHLLLHRTALTAGFIFQSICASACFLTLVSRLTMEWVQQKLQNNMFL